MGTKVVSQQELIRRLYFPETAERICANLEAVSKPQTEASVEERLQILRDARHDPELARSIAAVRVERIASFVWAHNWALSFFEQVSLRDDETAVEITETQEEEFKVWLIGQGQRLAPKRQIFESDTEVQYLMKIFETENVEYPTMDINRGALQHRDRTDRRLANAMSRKYDKMCKALLDSAKKSTGLRSTLTLHSDVVLANIPNANYLDLSATGTAGQLDVEKMKQILDYFERWTGDVEEDGVPLTIKAMYMSSTMKRDFWDMTDLVSNTSGATVNDGKDTIPTPVRERIWTSGKMTDMFGYEFLNISRNTITAPYIYIASNKPVGTVWDKPGMAENLTVQDDGMRRRNIEQMYHHRVGQLSLPDRKVYRYLVVKC